MRLQELIWVLEDDPGCIFVYEQILNIRYRTVYFKSLKSFTDALENKDCEKPDFLIVDLGLEDGNFLTFLEKEDNMNLLKIPFMVVSSLDDIDALRYCYELGAIEYMIKPFKSTELIVKVEQKLKVVQEMRQQFADSFASKENLGARFSELTLKESSILTMFMKTSNNRLTREEIMEEQWRGVTVQNKTVDVHLHNIRRKITPLGITIKSISPGVWELVKEK